jgi:hypothetical protein
MAEPTKKQKECLAKFMDEDPHLTSSRQYSYLIGFILNGGPGFTDMNPVQRANIFQKRMREWNGQRVRHAGSGETGTVRYVFVTNPFDRAYMARDGVQTLHPFQAIVDWDARKACSISLNGIKRCEG